MARKVRHNPLVSLKVCVQKSYAEYLVGMCLSHRGVLSCEAEFDVHPYAIKLHVLFSETKGGRTLLVSVHGWFNWTDQSDIGR
jgi:hypothetical protein